MEIGVNGDLSTLYWRQNAPFEPDTVPCKVTYGTLLSKPYCQHLVALSICKLQQQPAIALQQQCSRLYEENSTCLYSSICSALCWQN